MFGNGRGFGGGIPVTFRSASDPAKCAGSFSCGRAASGHCAVEQRDEVAPLHSITSSARASSVGGTSKPSAFVVLRLITSSYLVGVCTGRSAGLSPLRMRPV